MEQNQKMNTSILISTFQIIVVIILLTTATTTTSSRQGDINIEEPFTKFNSPYGCIETREITILFYGEAKKTKMMTQMFRFFHRNLVEKTSCYTIYVYLESLQRTIPLLGEDDTKTYNLIEAGLPVKSSQPIINDYRIHGQTSTSQNKQTILYIVITSNNQTESYHELDLLQKQKHWDILVACNPSVCPTGYWIPINRVLPYDTSYQWLHNTLALLRNPDYNRFDNDNANTLLSGQKPCTQNSSKWKSINIIVDDFKENYLTLAIDSGLLLNSQQQKQQQRRKIIFYNEEADEAPQQFWRYYLKAHGIDHLIEIVSFSLNDIFNHGKKKQSVIPKDFEKVKDDIFVAVGDFTKTFEIHWICRIDTMIRFPKLIVYHILVAERTTNKHCFLATIKGLEYESDLFKQIKRDRPEVCD